jgi:phosphoesterase RecJ-like protein
LKLWGKVFSNSRVTNDNFLVSVIKRNEVEEDGDMDQLSGAIDYLNMVPDVKFSMLLKEDRGNVKGSLRTRRNDVDLSEIAKKFGGGGHPKAAGFSMPGKLKKDELDFEVSM